MLHQSASFSRVEMKMIEWRWVECAKILDQNSLLLGLAQSENMPVCVDTGLQLVAW
jgi:hypothetical protein